MFCRVGAFIKYRHSDAISEFFKIVMLVIDKVFYFNQKMHRLILITFLSLLLNACSFSDYIPSAPKLPCQDLKF
jgi:hypothetical protein